MISLKNKPDNKKRLNFSKFEEKYIIIKNIINGVNLKNVIKWNYSSKFHNKLWQKSKTKIKNRCILSGRSRSIYRFAKISRLFLRDNQFMGYLPGLKKSYW